MNREPNRAGKWGLALWLLCAAPMVTLAELADKPDKPDRPVRSERAAAAPNSPGSPSDAEGKGRRLRPGAEEARREVEQFMEKHSKRKWEVFQKLNPENKRVVWGQLLNRYSELKKVANPELYELEVKRVEIEDELFGALSDLKHATSAGDKEKIRGEELRPAVVDLIHNRMAERQVRLSNLKNQVERLEKEVENDKALNANGRKFESVVTARAKQLEQKELEGAGPDPRPLRRNRGLGTGPATAPSAFSPSRP
jgi:hypothetical protein